MPSKNPAQRLRDVIDNIDAILAFVAGMTFDDFVRDRKTIYAVTRALEIISEASRRLPDDLKHRHPEIDWPAGMEGVPVSLSDVPPPSPVLRRNRKFLASTVS